MYRPTPSTVFTPFSSQAAPDVSQLPQEHVQPVHNACCLDTIVRQSAGVGVPDVASWVGDSWSSPGQFRASRVEGMGGPGVFGTLRELIKL